MDTDFVLIFVFFCVLWYVILFVGRPPDDPQHPSM
jgi:hypothetical protein